ncbi:GNAT family N-acetyltransferase [Chloroflexales bacterium ZM16-3]|nr:GNAT family N-acetyltransferase [Chloroflexales bacterium ZM16-3]
MSPSAFLAPAAYVSGEITIRAYRPGDGPALQRAVVTSYQHLRPWMPWAKPEQSVDESEALCRSFAGKYLLGQEFTLGIWIGDELVGGTGYHLRWGPLELGNAEIGMWVSAARAGQGLGTRALSALLEWGFTAWPWQRLVWLCDTRNLASARVAEKGGLVREGTFRSDALTVDGSRRDTHLFAILRDEWLRRA